MRTLIGGLLLCGIVAWTAMPAHSASDPLIHDLTSGKELVRQNAARLLGERADRAAVPALIRALRDADTAVRVAAAHALARLDDARAVPGLLVALRDNDKNVQFAAAYALGEIKSEESVDGLLDAMDDPEWTVRDQAAWALAEIGSSRAIEPLVRSIAQPEADVPHVLWILKRLPMSKSTESLTRLLQASDVRIRRRAVEGLTQIGGAEATTALRTALNDDAAAIRLAAIHSLEKLRAKASYFQPLAATDPDPAVRKAAEAAFLNRSRHKDLAAYWSFDDGDTKRATDSSGAGNHGEILGCPSVKGKSGAALQFSQGHFVELGQPRGLPIANKPLTVMAWVKTDKPNGVVVARGGAYCGFSLYIKDGLPKFGIHREQDAPAFIAAGKNTIGNDWVHLAGVLKRDSVEVYVNGQLQGKSKADGYIPANCGQGMEIGFDTANSPAEITDAFEGIIDEVRVYHAALDVDEIAQEAGLAKK